MGKNKRKRKRLLPSDWRKTLYRLNMYSCPEGHVVTTMDVDNGVTPAAIKCPVKGCDHEAYSSFYPKERPIPDFVPVPSFEWYAPSDKELEVYPPVIKEQVRRHVAEGGLDLRPISGKKPLMHTENTDEHESDNSA